MIRALFALMSVSLVAISALASALENTQFQRGVDAIQKMTGCYLIDYSYVESESLKAGYERDKRVYDVNKNRTIKEWIYSETLSPTEIRLQHILFGVELGGKVIEESFLRHQAEDWQYQAPFLYDFTGPLSWNVKTLDITKNEWTRKITNLDDGLRYQCSAPWSMTSDKPEWSCSNYAPIPGRETRDMSRKDYQTLDRFTRIVVYGNSWLERQENIKTIHSASGEKTSLAKELGKNWYVRLDDSECAPAQKFVETRQAFWTILRETWAEVLVGDRAFIEKSLPGTSRYMKVLELEATYADSNFADPEVRNALKAALVNVIQEFRAN